MFKKFFFILFFFFISFFFYWALFVPKEDLFLKISKELKKQTHKVDLLMKGVVFSESIGKKKYWQIRAAKSTVNKDIGVAILENVDGIIFSNNKPYIKFSSPIIKWEIKKHYLRIEKPIGHEKFYKFNVPFLEWAIEDNKLFSEGDIQILGRNIEVKSKKLSGKPDIKEINLESNVSAKLWHKGELVVLTAEKLTIDGNTGNILAKGKCNLKSNELSLNSEEISFEPKSNYVRLLENVIFNHRDITATCKKAEFLLGGRIVTLQYNVNAKKGDNVIRTDKLKIDLKSNRIIMDGQSEIFIEE